MTSRGRLRDIGYGSLVALLVTATLSVGAVLFQLFEQTGHVHPGSPATSSLPIAVDTIGFAMMFLLGGQLMTGYRLVGVNRDRFRAVHVRTAWAVVGLLLFHGVAAVIHSFEVPELLPTILDFVGLGLVALVGLQLLSGYRRSRPSAKRARASHATLALALALIVAGHSALAIVHTLTG